MIEKRTVVLDRRVPDDARGVDLLCAADGSAYWVSCHEMQRVHKASGLSNVFEVKGVRATFELVDGRWTLASLERP